MLVNCSLTAGQLNSFLASVGLHTHTRTVTRAHKHTFRLKKDLSEQKITLTVSPPVKMGLYVIHLYIQLRLLLLKVM